MLKKKSLHDHLFLCLFAPTQASSLCSYTSACTPWPPMMNWLHVVKSVKLAETLCLHVWVQSHVTSSIHTSGGVSSFFFFYSFFSEQVTDKIICTGLAIFVRLAGRLVHLGGVPWKPWAWRWHLDHGICWGVFYCLGNSAFLDQTLMGFLLELEGVWGGPNRLLHFIATLTDLTW